MTFEYLLTLEGEIAFIWRRRISPVGILFVMNRYGALVYGALAIASGYTSSDAVSTLPFSQYVFLSSL